MGKEFNPHRIFSVPQNGPRIIVLFTNMATETSCKCQRVITPVKTSYFLTIIRVIILDVKTCEVFLCSLTTISLALLCWLLRGFFYVNCFMSFVILGDPGAFSGGKEKSKRAESFFTFLRVIFFGSFRLSSPPPLPSAPGFPRMVTREPVHRLLHRVWADNSISLTFSLLKVGQLSWSWREKILVHVVSSERDSKIILLPCRLRYQENLKFLSFHVAVVHKRQIIWQ